MSKAWLLGLWCFVALLGLPVANASSSLGADGRKLVARAQKDGARATSKRSWFLQEGDRRRVALRLSTKECTSLVLLVSQGKKAWLGLSSEPRSKGLETQAGVGLLTRCGRRKAALRSGVSVRMMSARGAVDLIQLEHKKRPQDWLTALPKRYAIGKPLPPPAMPAFRVPAVDVRVKEALQAATEQGAKRPLLLRLVANKHGRGGAALQLKRGCHRLSVVAAATAASRGRVDVDADIRRKGGARALAEDHGQAPDAVLSLCIASDAALLLRFLGAARKGRVYLVQASWPWPFLPAKGWPEDAQARLAWALYRSGVQSLPAKIYKRYVGASGDTALPLHVESGRCYFAAATATQGQVAALRLEAALAGRRYVDAVSRSGSAVALSFCAKKDGRVKLRVRQVGRSAWWLLQLWKTGDLRP